MVSFVDLPFNKMLLVRFWVLCDIEDLASDRFNSDGTEKERVNRDMIEDRRRMSSFLDIPVNRDILGRY